MTQKSLLLKNHSKSKLDWKAILIEFFASVLILVYIYTAITKLIDFRSFSIQLSQNPIFRSNSLLFAYGGPSIELLVAFAIVFKRTRSFGFIASALLMAFFTWYVAYMMMTLPHLPCSCGGVVGWLNWPQHLILNITLTIFSVAGYFMWKSHIKKI
ncbi:MauE/DoxX family redox-associated membrane protein [Chitinophaga rhizosphaerae]|uniref:MauE/DoxX family redox-associated membrane protein n=1 Tax=Chitinophaga rhizosphaerae TaxID=1864947 RepID=UPI000F810767|nr:MauE/DoxX family redox-associated membrane protein [Chitinophaga rhizosphaerae]